jgi:secreted trypsin-like serine protease
VFARPNILARGILTSSNATNSIKDEKMTRLMEAAENSFPSHALIYTDQWNNRGKTCGGVLIATNKVISTAKCIGITEDVNRYLVVLGLHDKYNLHTSAVQQRQVSSVYQHKDFDPETYRNDIAVLFLSKRVEINRSVQLACVNSQKNLVGRSAGVVGWGQSDKLHNEAVMVMSAGECSWSNHWNNDAHLCAGLNSVYLDTSASESGSGLFMNNGDKAYVIGLASFFADSTRTFGFTRVSHYKNFFDNPLAFGKRNAAASSFLPASTATKLLVPIISSTMMLLASL